MLGLLSCVSGGVGGGRLGKFKLIQGKIPDHNIREGWQCVCTIITTTLYIYIPGSSCVTYKLDIKSSLLFMSIMLLLPLPL